MFDCQKQMATGDSSVARAQLLPCCHLWGELALASLFWTQHSKWKHTLLLINPLLAAADFGSESASQTFPFCLEYNPRWQPRFDSSHTLHPDLRLVRNRWRIRDEHSSSHHSKAWAARTYYTRHLSRLLLHFPSFFLPLLRSGIKNAFARRKRDYYNNDHLKTWSDYAHTWIFFLLFHPVTITTTYSLTSPHTHPASHTCRMESLKNRSFVPVLSTIW